MRLGFHGVLNSRLESALSEHAAGDADGSSGEGSKNLRENLSVVISPQDNQLFEFDKFVLDPKRRRLLSRGEPVSLPPKAIELLVLLVRNRGKVLEKDALMSALLPDIIVEEANLSQNIYLIRKALGKTTDGQSFIETYSKRGYRF